MGYRLDELPIGTKLYSLADRSVIGTVISHHPEDDDSVCIDWTNGNLTYGYASGIVNDKVLEGQTDLV